MMFGKNPAFWMLAVGLFIAAACGWLLIETAEEIWFQESLVGLDAKVFDWLQPMQSPTGVAFARIMTRLGNPLPLTVTVGLAAVVLGFAGSRAEAWIFGGGASGASLMVAVLKWIFHRARPDSGLSSVLANSPAFPSGHAAMGVIVYVFLGCLISLHFRSLGARLLIIGVSIILSLMIGISRLYLGVHWFSDVAAGFALAGMWLAPMLGTVAIYHHRHPSTVLGGRVWWHSLAYLVVLATWLAFLMFYALGRLPQW
jgi:undecaprenyl-diphosphatase